MLIVLDDTVLNGDTHSITREWLSRKFVLVGVHSMPYNAFFKAKANIKTSVLHLRRNCKRMSSKVMFLCQLAIILDIVVH